MAQHKCPIYNSYAACDENPDCVFLRTGGCAVILGMDKSFDNEQKLAEIQTQLNTVTSNLHNIINGLNQRR